MNRTATCSCGRLRVSVRGEPDRVLACNCRECQRRTGSVFGVAAYFARSAVGGVEGERKTFTRSAGEELRFETSFCPSCGSSVFWSSSALPDHVAVAVGCFADPAFPPPDIVSWTSDKHGWVRFPESCQRFDKSGFGGPAPVAGDRQGGPA
jgi:hypothetical protein